MFKTRVSRIGVTIAALVGVACPAAALAAAGGQGRRAVEYSHESRPG